MGGDIIGEIQLGSEGELYKYHYAVVKKKRKTKNKKTKKNKYSVCVCFLPIHSGHQWTYQPGSHRRKVTQEF